MDRAERDSIIFDAKEILRRMYKVNDLAFSYLGDMRAAPPLEVLDKLGELVEELKDLTAPMRTGEDPRIDVEVGDGAEP